MLVSSIAGRAARFAPRGQQVAKITQSVMISTASPSPCSQLRSPLPGIYGGTTELWPNANATEGPGEVETMHNEADVEKLLASSDPESLVVIKFHAIMCNASKAIEDKFKQTAAEFGDMGGQQVIFADICFDSNRQLCARMGIKSVPHVQIFSGFKGKIADFGIAPLQYNTLTSLLSERRECVGAGKGH